MHILYAILTQLPKALADTWFVLVAVALAGIVRPFVHARLQFDSGVYPAAVAAATVYKDGVRRLKSQWSDHLFWSLQLLARIFIVGVGLLGWGLLATYSHDVTSIWESPLLPLAPLCAFAVLARWLEGASAVRAGIGIGLSLVGVALFGLLAPSEFLVSSGLENAIVAGSLAIAARTAFFICLPPAVLSRDEEEQAENRPRTLDGTLLHMMQG